MNCIAPAARISQSEHELIDNGTAAETDGPHLFPNPATTEFEIVHPAGEIIRNVDLYDVSGKADNSFTRTGNTIRLSATPKGIYIVKVAFETHVWIGKVMVK